jgi:DNA-binding transcriptional ArsR family regulator
MCGESIPQGPYEYTSPFLARAVIQTALGVEVIGMEEDSTRDALNHRVRRQILRTLIASDRPLAPVEIVAAGLPSASLSTVAYHARVLEGSGSVSRANGEAPPRYTTDLSANPEVVALLEATRRADETGT